MSETETNVQKVQAFLESQCNGFQNCPVPHDAWVAIVEALGDSERTREAAAVGETLRDLWGHVEPDGFLRILRDEDTSEPRVVVVSAQRRFATWAATDALAELLARPSGDSAP